MGGLSKVVHQRRLPRLRFHKCRRVWAAVCRLGSSVGNSRCRRADCGDPPTAFRRLRTGRVHAGGIEGGDNEGNHHRGCRCWSILLGGCSSASPHHAAAAPAATTAPTLTASQGAAICNDLKAWLPGAFNQDMPRFNAQLESDESEAAGTPLGTDLSNLDSNLQQLNSVAFFPSPPGYTAGPPTGIGALQQDCAAYGVNIKLPSS